MAINSLKLLPSKDEDCVPFESGPPCDYFNLKNTVEMSIFNFQGQKSPRRYNHFFQHIHFGSPKLPCIESDPPPEAAMLWEALAMWEAACSCSDGQMDSPSWGSSPARSTTSPVSKEASKVIAAAICEVPISHCHCSFIPSISRGRDKPYPLCLVCEQSKIVNSCN